MNIEGMNETVAKAARLIEEQQKTISRYEKLTGIQDWALKALSKTLQSVCDKCADVARITDDPEVQNKMFGIVEDVEKLQEVAQKQMKELEDI